mmetsp:Transcript_162873/g.522197  ORF Transcript_162873/g.522197 Transcript_162873/m.522197 type:complete len:268 (-) Transcript_162873:221-1024(-)
MQGLSSNSKPRVNEPVSCEYVSSKSEVLCGCNSCVLCRAWKDSPNVWHSSSKASDTPASRPAGSSRCGTGGGSGGRSGCASEDTPRACLSAPRGYRWNSGCGCATAAEEELGVGCPDLMSAAISRTLALSCATFARASRSTRRSKSEARPRSLKLFTIASSCSTFCCSWRCCVTNVPTLRSNGFGRGMGRRAPVGARLPRASSAKQRAAPAKDRPETTPGLPGRSGKLMLPPPGRLRLMLRGCSWNEGAILPPYTISGKIQSKVNTE